MTPTAFRNAMIGEIRAQHLVAAAAAHGGWKQVPPSAWGRTGRLLREEFRFIDALTRAAVDGRINPRSRAFGSRVASYGGQARQRYAEEMRRMVEESDHEFEARWVLGAAEHCAGCVSEPRGWSALDQVGEIGTHECRWFCRCSKEYRLLRRRKNRSTRAEEATT